MAAEDLLGSGYDLLVLVVLLVVIGVFVGTAEAVRAVLERSKRVRCPQCGASILRSEAAQHEAWHRTR